MSAVVVGCLLAFLTLLLALALGNIAYRLDSLEAINKQQTELIALQAQATAAIAKVKP